MQGGRLAVVNSNDLIKLLMRHPKMQGLRDEAGTALVQRESGAAGGIAIAVRSWTVKGKEIGTFQPASILAELPGIGDIDDPTQLNGKTIRQLGQGKQDKEGKDVDGLFVLADAASALVYDDPKAACRWANNTNQVNPEIAKSLTYVESGHSSVSLLNFTKI